MVEVLDVRLADLGARLRGASLDAPAAGDAAGDTYALDLRGWAVGTATQAAVAVEVACGDRLIARRSLDVERADVARHLGSDRTLCGFFGPINALLLPVDFELAITAVLEDGTTCEFARVRGRRRRLGSPFRPTLEPLIVTTIGRTGSSMLVHLLGAHPQVVAYRPFLVEPRVLSYWMAVLGSLADPVSYRRQIQQARDLGEPDWWLGRQGPGPRPIHDPELHSWLGGEAVEELAGLCQARADAVYGRIAAGQGRSEASFFAEKCLPGAVPALAWELYEGCREVVLVRDPRDMLCSMLAYGSRPAVRGFGRREVASDAEFVPVVGEAIDALERDWRSRSDHAHLVRYEDLVLDRPGALRAMLAYAGLDGEEDVIESMLHSLDEASDADGHRTTSSAADSVGRWRRELDPDVQRLCNERFARPLDAFGYAP